MGYALRRWLADRLPLELSSGERLVALEIADQANEETRLAYGKNLLQTVARRTGFANEKQVGHVLGKLAKRSIELRVQLTKNGEPFFDGKGRPVFAYEKHETTYKIPFESECPALVPCPQDQPGPVGAGPDAPSGPASGAEWSRADGRVVPRARPTGPASAGPFSSGSPHDSSSLLSHERVVMEALAEYEVTVDEMREVIKEIRQATKGKIENPTSYFRAIAQRGDLPDYLNRVRANAERRAAYAARPTPPPGPDPEPPQATTAPEEKEAILSATRERLDALRRSQNQRRPTSPTRVLPPRQAPEELPADVQAAREELDRLGDRKFDLIAAARDKLGPEVHRNEVFILAAQLARSNTRPSVQEAS